MGTIKIAGKGFEILGKILQADEIEQWVEAKGKEIVESKFQDLSLKWFRGKARAKSKAIREIKEDTTAASTDAFRGLMETSLNKFSALLVDSAQTLRQKNGLYETAGYSSWEGVVAVPRCYILEVFKRSLVRDVGGSAQFEKFEGLPEIFLARSARDAEEAFASKCGRGVSLDNPDWMVIGVDMTWDWFLGEPIGHYYVGFYTHGDTNLNVKKDQKNFLSRIEGARRSLADNIAAKSRTELKELILS